jgi:protein-S-isoprenylcysteine O-methyltransferase Ste14
MQLRDGAIYGAHMAFWAAFGITQRLVGAGRAVSESAPAAAVSRTAAYSRLVLGVHFVAFGLMYLGIGIAIVPGPGPDWFWGQRLVGATVLALGAWLMCWSLLYLRSWRFRAQLDVGHELATGGPYAFVRHPIYAGMNLLAVGTAVWIPTPLTWIAAGLMLLGSDLRGRAEERVLSEAFGESYHVYCVRTKRFIPGLY